MKEQLTFQHWGIRQLLVVVIRTCLVFLLLITTLPSNAKKLFLSNSNEFTINSFVLYSTDQKCSVFNIVSKKEFLFSNEYINPFVVIKFFHGGVNSVKQNVIHTKPDGVEVAEYIIKNVLKALYENQFVSIHNLSSKKNNKTFEISLDTLYYQTVNSVDEYIGLFVYEYYQIKCYKSETIFQSTNSIINKCAKINELSDYTDIDSIPIKVDGELIQENKMFLIQKIENELVFFQYSYLTPQGYQKLWYDPDSGIVAFKSKIFYIYLKSNTNQTQDLLKETENYFLFLRRPE